MVSNSELTLSLVGSHNSAPSAESANGPAAAPNALLLSDLNMAQSVQQLPRQEPPVVPKLPVQQPNDPQNALPYENFTHSNLDAIQMQHSTYDNHHSEDPMYQEFMVSARPLTPHPPQEPIMAQFQ